MYKLGTGTVQPIVTGFSGATLMVHFGRAEYDRNLPILTDSLREQAEPIVADLNSGAISEAEGITRLKRLSW